MLAQIAHLQEVDPIALSSEVRTIAYQGCVRSRGLPSSWTQDRDCAWLLFVQHPALEGFFGDPLMDCSLVPTQIQTTPW